MEKSSRKLAEALCEQMSAEEERLTRDIINRMADKWSLWTMNVLANAKGPLRFSRIQEQVQGISQKSLTKTLRQLEREGLLARRIFAEVPPRVEYEINPIGREMLDRVEPVWLWVVGNVQRFQAARSAFDSAAHGKARPAAPVA